MKPATVFDLNRNMIRELVARHGLANPRVFGSVARGDDDEGSDLDLLVDPVAGRTTLYSLVRLRRELQDLTGLAVDIATPLSLKPRLREQVLAEARPV